MRRAQAGESLIKSSVLNKRILPVYDKDQYYFLILFKNAHDWVLETECDATVVFCHESAANLCYLPSKSFL